MNAKFLELPKYSMRLAIVVGLLLGTLPEVSAGILDGPIWNPANGHAYFLLDSSTWTDAETQAQALGGHLVTINDAAEDQWVYSTFSAFGGQGRHLWLGLSTGGNDGAIVSNYHWADGETLTYNHFVWPEPNFHDEYFVFILGPDFANAWIPSGQWNNWYDIAAAAYAGGSLLPVNGVVELVPEPSIWSLAALCLVVCVWPRPTTRARPLALASRLPSGPQ